MPTNLCVFCGHRPSGKTKEHILPQWLLALTGDPKRIVELGIKKQTGSLTKHTFAFAQFTQPACEACNHTAGHLEAAAKDVLSSFVVGSPLSAQDCSLLLDWFDKVRIGLWLAHRSLDKNFYQIEPKFYINDRIGRHDRMLAVYHTDYSKQGLTFSGTDLPIFAHVPSCFALRVNSTWFLNISYDCLFSKPLGLPYPRARAFLEDHKTSFDMVPGTGSLKSPLMRPSPIAGAAEFYQPSLALASAPDVSELYATAHVRALTMPGSPGVGAVLYRQSSRPTVIPSTGISGWSSPLQATDAFLPLFVNRLIGIQIAILRRHPSLERLPKIEQLRIGAHFRDLAALQTGLLR